MKLQPPVSLADLNAADTNQALALISHWCAAPGWAHELCACRPFSDTEALLALAEQLWQRTTEEDRLAAFSAHPVIGDVELLRNKFATQANVEQGQVLSADDTTIAELAMQNKAYSERHGFTFIVFATGKSAEQMLELLNNRIDNTRAQEISNAADEQLKIMQLRLRQSLTAN